jgi:hypothetical protein
MHTLKTTRTSIFTPVAALAPRTAVEERTAVARP